MSEPKTRPTDQDVDAFLDGVAPASRRDDARRLDAIFRAVTGFTPVIWGSSIVGYGQYHYTYASGRSGVSPATGFAPRKSSLVLYIMPGYADFGDILDHLGPHRLGKACLYVTRLERLNVSALERLIIAGLDDLRRHWPVEPGG